MKKVSKNSLNEEVLDDLIDGADIDGDGIIDYKKHLNLIANTLLQLNVSGNQVNNHILNTNATIYLGTLSKNCRREQRTRYRIIIS